MLWAFRSFAVLTVGLMLTSAVLLTRAFLEFDGKEAAIVGLVAGGAAMVTGGVAGYMLPILYPVPNSWERADDGKSKAAKDAGRSGSLSLVLGLVGVGGFGAATIYGLVANGEPSPLPLVGLFLSLLNTGVELLLRRRRAARSSE